jgi:uncharacterized repeat protein (TIGR01451 family)
MINYQKDKKNMKTIGSDIQIRSILAFLLIISLIASFFSISISPQRIYAVSPDVVISQVYGGGGQTGAPYKNDFVELFNRGTTTVSLAGWSVQYASATGTGNFSNNPVVSLAGSLAPGQYFLVQLASGGGNGVVLPAADATGTINMGSTGGKVVLVTSTTGLDCNGSSTPCTPEQMALIKDLVGWGGANFYEGSGAAPATSVTTAILRGNGGYTDTDNNSADFIASTPDPRNTSSPLNPWTGPTAPTGIGAANPNILFTFDSTLLTVAITPGTNPPSTGLTVTGDLSSIGGSATQLFYDDGTDGDVTAGDNIFSYSATVASGTAGGVKSLTCTISDAQSRSSSASIWISVAPIIPIGTVQGSVGDLDDGTAFRSPYAPPSGNGLGQTVIVQGVVYEKTLQAISGSPNTYKGFFIQNTAATMDADPNTSDGLFVFMNINDNIGAPGGTTYTPAVGDEVVITGRVSEYYNVTELNTPTLAKPVVRSGVDLEVEVPAFEVYPPDNLADANRYWERREGMRAQVPEGSIVLGGRNVFSPPDAEIWLARPDSTIAQRTDSFERRAFRDAHPLDDNYDPLNWDGNGYRILMGSLGIKATLGDGQALIDPARTFDTVTNAPVGGVNYTYSKYRIEITSQPSLSEGVDPAANSPPQPFDRSNQYSIADYDLENLFDYRDDPFSDCDFPGNPGCPQVPPFLYEVNPPFDYIPASDADYQAHLDDIALQIINDLHNPDILMVQGVENQDICTAAGGTLIVGAIDNADGKPDVLQELALKIAALGGPSYDAAFDRDSTDLRGLAPAFLYRTDRVELLPPAGDPLLGSSPAIVGYTAVPYDSDVSNPKALNAVLPPEITPYQTTWVFLRAASVALFRIYSTSIGVGSYRDVYVINNHFTNGPDIAVAHRTEQAKYSAAMVDFLQASNPGARVVLGGCLGDYPRPDDPFAPIGQPGSSDQLGSLYDPSHGLKNLWEVLLGQAPESAYTTIYLGMAQTLDHLFVNQEMFMDLQQYRIAHINCDFPADYPGDGPRGIGAYDPNMATFIIDHPPNLQVAKAVALETYADGDGVPGPGETLKYTIVMENTGDIAASGVVFSDTPDSNTRLIAGSVTATLGSVTEGNAPGDTSVEVDIGDIPAHGGVTITFKVQIKRPVYTEQITNQAQVKGTNFPSVKSDDPGTSPTGDPTIIQIRASPPQGVGGEIKPVDRVSVVVPWIGLASILSIGGVLIFLRWRRAS